MKRLLLSFLACIAFSSPECPAAGRPPNVVLVMTDDQGHGDLAAHGNPWVRTPTLDRLRAESVRFTQFHVDPTCSPTRAALLTGRYSTRTGCWHTIMGRSLIFHDEVLLPQFLREAGYTTGIFGKWHLGDNFPMRPRDRGFDTAVVHGGGGVGQTPDHWGNDYFDDTYHSNGVPVKFAGYCTEVFVNEAMKFADRHADRPFFLYLATNVPHSPYNVPDSHREYYAGLGLPNAPARFYGMIEHFDGQLGRLLSFLRERGLEENTIFIFMTDNGTAEGIPWGNPEDSRWTGFNAGMRGKKGTQYDGGHRVPFFIRWPAGNLGGGRDVVPLAAHIDVLPTLLELCGIEASFPNPIDGLSLVPLLRGGSSNWPQRTLFAHVQREEIPPKWNRSSVLTDRWRLIDGGELYDMLADPGQTTDVAVAFPEVVRRLRSDYEVWWQSLTPAFGRFGRITIGADAENPAHITCHDWHSDEPVPWDQGHIRRDLWVNGHWEIEVARAGTYEFTLRRQPAEAAFPLGSPTARLRVGEMNASADVPEGATSVTLTLRLPSGPARMQTWLADAATSRSRGAFFVEVRRLD